MSFPRSRSDTCPAATLDAANPSRRTTPATTRPVMIGLSHREGRNEEGPRRAPPHERSSETAPRPATDRLEHEPDRELQVAHLVLGRGRGDAARVRSRVGCGADRVVRLPEVHVIEDVHALDSELQVARAPGAEP